MHTTTRHMLVFCSLLAASVAQGEGDFDPTARAKAIAPYLDEQTIAVVHADLRAVEWHALVDKFVELVPEARLDEDEVLANLNQAQSAFRKTGFTDLYIVVSLADVPVTPPFVIAPKTVESSVAELQKLLPRFGGASAGERLEELPHAAFIGPRRTLERLRGLEPAPRPELVEAFRAAGDTAIQLLLLPTDNDRRVVEELMPTLPKEIGGWPSTVLTRGVRWLALGVSATPKISLHLAIQSADAEAAAALRAKLLDTARLLARKEIPAKALPEFEEGLALLTPKVQGDRLALNVVEPDRGLKALLDAVTPPIERVRKEGMRHLSSDHLKHLGLAMHNFYDTHKRLPAIGTFDAAGKPLLSWRVHLLPYVEEPKLYGQFHLDEPWDSEHNRRLIDKMPEVFRCPASKHRRKDGLATYRLVVGEHTVFPGPAGIELKQITDGLSDTIMIVEVDDEHAVVWTKPEGLPFNARNPAEGLGGHFEGGFQCAFCDGSAHFLELPHDPKRLRCLLLRDDGNPISW